MPKQYILCVDDEKLVLDAMLRQLRDHLGTGYMYEVAEGGEEGLEILEDLLDQGEEVAIIISDQMMPNMPGDEFLVQAHQIWPDAVKILLTGINNPQALARAVNEAKLYRYLTKPWDKTDLQLTAEEALKTYNQRRRIDQYTETLENLLDTSKKISRETELARLVQTLNEILVERLQVDRGGILVYDDEQPFFYQFFEKQGEELTFSQDYSRFPHWIIEATAKGYEPVHVPISRRHVLIHQEYYNKYGPKSIYCKPLYEHERLTAILYMESLNNRDHFNDDRIQFLDLLGYEAAVAVEKARLIHNLEKTVEMRTTQVVQQSREIENKSKEITESIHYARRLQMSFMQPEESLRRLFPEAFVYYRPKDIVSGDFYWWAEVGDQIIVAAVDCTGHGVPGAMLAILGLNLLEELIQREKLVDTGEIVSRLHRTLIQRLGGHKQEEDEGEFRISDSMDLALISINRNRMTLEFTGAFRNLHILREGKLLNLKGDRMSVGGHPLNRDLDYHFHSRTLQLQPEDQLYLYTDGITDQFCANDDERYSTRRLHDFLVRTGKLGMAEISKQLDCEMTQWIGPTEQTDDILLLGLSMRGLQPFGMHSKAQRREVPVF